MPQFAVADNSSAASSLLNRLSAAANQQATQQRLQANTQAAQDRQDQQDYFRAIQDGWVPAQAETRLPGGLIDRTQPTQPNMDPKRMATIGRKQMYKPTDAEALNDTNSFSLSDDLAAEAQKAGLTNIKAGTRYPKADMQALDARLAAWHKQNDPKPPVRQEINFNGQDASGNPSPFAVDPTTLKSSPVNLPDGVTLPTKLKAEKPDVSQMIPGQQGPNGGMLIYDKNDQEIREVPYPKGSKPVLNAAQTEADKDRHARQSELDDARSTRLSTAEQVREEKASKDHEAAGLKKEAMQGMAQGFYDAAGTQPGGTYFPPRFVNGIVVPGPATLMPTDKDQIADRQKALKTAAQGFEKTAKTHQAEQKRIEKARGWGEFAPAQAAQPSAAPVAKPVVAAAKPVAAAAPAKPAADPAAPPASVTQGLAPGTHTFGNGQTWRKGADGSMKYVSGGR